MTELAQVVGETHDDVVVANVTGEIDASNADRVGTRVRAITTNRTAKLVLDLSAVTYLDSAGIALIYELAGELNDHQGTLELVVGPNSTMTRLLIIAGVNRTVAVHHSRAAAQIPG